MLTKIIENKLSTLNAELQWFSDVLELRLKLFFNQEKIFTSIFDLEIPNLSEQKDAYATLVQQNDFSRAERLVLMLALSPYLKPSLLDIFYLKNSATDNRFSEFGCLKPTHHSGLIPTLETALFLLAGTDLEQRIYYFNHFNQHHLLFKKQWLLLENKVNDEPSTTAAILPSPELLEWISKGQEYSPEFSATFPARRINTSQGWKDLILSEETLTQIEEIKAWILYGEQLMETWELGKKMMPGYRSLFFGSSGTGKTMTAALLGKLTGREVYKIDLSTVVSKFIGETEKNLSVIFDRAEYKNWILFFDEADALFGKRTNVKDAHDKYANQEVSFLLQRIEDFNGVVILATNFRSNIDDAFVRRFQSVIQFSIPDSQQRFKIWQNSFSKHTKLAENVDLKQISEKFELAGGAIMNVIRYASLMAANRLENIIQLKDLQEGIRREYHKDGRTL